MGGQREPFTMIRVNGDFILQLVHWGTSSYVHLVFSLPRKDLDEVFTRLKECGIEFGDAFHSVGINSGPGESSG